MNNSGTKVDDAGRIW